MQPFSFLAKNINKLWATCKRIYLGGYVLSLINPKHFLLYLSVV